MIVSDTFKNAFIESSYASLEKYRRVVGCLGINSKKPLRQTTSKEYKPKGMPETIHPLMIYISKMNILSLLGVFSQLSVNSP